ncbi:hypothetical protein [Pseudomonas sp. F(2018)]|uniref:hypothetical protein n=1 Tax=Pseudomonas sp. F(2018) TaxID=2502240 RepID=UPI0010F86C5E|nr:hypothetical protein [Pseudomonas sp. F(2018)]
MSVQSGPTYKRYAANGIATVYAIPFLLIEAEDLQITLDGVLVTSGFTLTGVGNPSCVCTFDVAPLGDLLFQLVIPFERLDDYQENGDFLASTVNNDFDRLWQAAKELRRDDGRALAVDPLEPEGIPPLPVAAIRSEKVLAFDALGAPIPSNLTLAELEEQPEVAAAAAAAAAASALAASGSASAAATSETNAAAAALAAANTYDAFDDRYLGAKNADPALDNDGSALLTGAIYWNTVSNLFRVWNGASWQNQNSADYLNALRIDVATAATVNLNTLAPDTRHINLTGGVTITGFTIAAGKTYFVRFNAATTLTNNASIVTQSGADILAQAGDTCILRATASNVVEVLSYGTPLRPFTKEYVSAEQTITAGGVVTLAHGLGVKPKLVRAYLVCKTAEHGWSVNDEVNIEALVASASSYNYGYGANTTNIRAVCGGSGCVVHNASGSSSTVTAANWRLILRAWT